MTKFDDHTLAISSGTAKSRQDLLESLPFSPAPSHAIKITADWVKTYNWKLLPVTGPYQLGEVKKGKSVTFERVKDWWGNDERYFQHRFNPDRIELKVLRIRTSPGSTSCAASSIPSASDAQLVARQEQNAGVRQGLYRTPLVLQSDPSTPTGLYLNTADLLLRNLNVRLGIQHALNLDKMLTTLLRGITSASTAMAPARGVHQHGSQGPSV